MAACHAKSLKWQAKPKLSACRHRLASARLACGAPSSAAFRSSSACNRLRSLSAAGVPSLAVARAAARPAAAPSCTARLLTTASTAGAAAAAIAASAGCTATAAAAKAATCSKLMCGCSAAGASMAPGRRAAVAPVGLGRPQTPASSEGGGGSASVSVGSLATTAVLRSLLLAPLSRGRATRRSGFLWEHAPRCACLGLHARRLGSARSTAGQLAKNEEVSKLWGRASERDMDSARSAWRGYSTPAARSGCLPAPRPTPHLCSTLTGTDVCKTPPEARPRSCERVPEPLTTTAMRLE